MADVTVRNEGSIVLLGLHSEDARSFVDEHVADGAMFFADDIIDGMRDAGLTVEV